MTKIIKRIENLWHDKRSEFSREVSQKEKDALYAEVARNEQQVTYASL